MIGDDAVIEVGIFDAKVGGIGLSSAGFPKDFVEDTPVESASVRTQPAMFFLGDGATGFGGVFWPEFFGEDGVGDEAGLEGDCLDGLEVDRGGGAADVEELEEVATGGVCERGETQFFPSFIGKFA